MWKISILSSLFVLPKVYGHGYLSSPRSRNWVAHQDGTDSWSGSGSPGTPPREYCYHCLNSKAANEICGVGNANNYDEWLDLSGNPIPWNSQETYTEGDIITVKSTLTTNHAGHMDLFICPDGEASTQACLEANPVEYVDAVHHAPRDTKYPYRGYYSNSDYDFEMRYKLPMGVTGDKVMMQWRYVTGNSCMPPGYCCHNDDDYFEIYSNVSSWKRANTALCDYPLDPTGATGTGKPEQFWNCAEITILPGNSQPSTPSPTVSPVSQPTTTAPISSPTTPSPPSSNTPCCTIDFKNCSPTVAGWCSESQENCEGTCYKWWLPNGPVSGCNARFDSCVTDSDCCSPGYCDGTGTCQARESWNPTSPISPTTPNPTATPPVPTPTYNPTQRGPTSSPTIRPTMPPTVSSCCSFDYKFCGSNTFCNSSAQNCGRCNGLWIEDSLKTCIALWVECGGSSDECCGPAHCVDTSGDGSYLQCQPAPALTSPTTSAPTTLSTTPAPSISPPTPVPTRSPVSSTTNSPVASPVSIPTTSPTIFQMTSPPSEGCSAKGEPCEVNADCCMKKCKKKTGVCRK